MEGEGGETLCSTMAESKPNTETNTVPTTVVPGG
jgi:hypothetical protein